MSDLTNPVVKITEIEGRGRSLLASQSVKAGQIILRDSPILLYSAIPFQNPISSNYCFNCFKTLIPSSRYSCPSCSQSHSHHTHFCSPTCLSHSLSSSHSPWVCQALKSLTVTGPLLHPDVQTQLNFLITAYNLAIVSPSDFRLLLSLQGDPPATPNADTLAIHSLISSLSPPLSFAGFSLELTAALLAKDNLNAFGLMEPFQENGVSTVRAYGIYPKASFFNHDCLPNACRFDYVDTVPVGERNTDIIVRAIHDIPQGREICLSYFPVNLAYSERQKRLMEDYGFVCDCDRCKVEMNWSDPDEEIMEEDDDEQMEELDTENENSAEGETEFPHAYFFLRYMCDRENCGGTLAPLPPSDGNPSRVMECNVCGQLKAEENMNGEDDVSVR